MGLGRLLRLNQLHSLFHNRLKQRGPSESPLKALSLSNDETAVGFQRKFYLKTLEWTEAEPDAAREAIATMNAAEPRLNLIHINTPPRRSTRLLLYPIPPCFEVGQAFRDASSPGLPWALFSIFFVAHTRRDSNLRRPPSTWEISPEVPC